jgi:hypothetical protein
MEPDTKRALLAGFLVLIVFFLLGYQFSDGTYFNTTTKMFGWGFIDMIGLIIPVGLYMLADKYLI